MILSAVLSIIRTAQYAFCVYSVSPLVSHYVLLIKKKKKMKKIVFFSFLLILNTGFAIAHSGDTINVLQGTTPTIDGIINAGEWSDASSVHISGINGTIYFKRNDTKLFVAFTSDSYYYQSTGIYVDKLHNGGTTPQIDDLWLHGSAGQYEWCGNGTSWQSSAPSDWNYVVSAANEYEISLSKLDIITNTNNTLGVLFSFLDWSSGNEITWPDGGYTNLGIPNSYADMILKFETSVIENSIYPDEICVFPNPSNDRIEIEGLNNVTMEIMDIRGHIIKSIDASDTKTSIDISELSAGIYILRARLCKGIITKKFFKE